MGWSCELGGSSNFTEEVASLVSIILKGPSNQGMNFATWRSPEDLYSCHLCNVDKQTWSPTLKGKVSKREQLHWIDCESLAYVKLGLRHCCHLVWRVHSQLMKENMVVAPSTPPPNYHKRYFRPDGKIGHPLQSYIHSGHKRSGRRIEVKIPSISLGNEIGPFGCWIFKGFMISKNKERGADQIRSPFF